jgi:ERCC4-type nuclease
LQIKSNDNLVNLFTKSIPLATFDKCMKDIGMRRLKDLQGSGGRFSLNKNSVFSHNYRKRILLVLQESSYINSQIVQGEVLQIHSNMNLNTRFKWPVYKSSNNRITTDIIAEVIRTRTDPSEIIKHMPKPK